MALHGFRGDHLPAAGAFAGIVKDQRMGKWINYSLADRKALVARGILGEQ
jgi:hypothetical protein